MDQSTFFHIVSVETVYYRINMCNLVTIQCFNKKEKKRKIKDDNV